MTTVVITSMYANPIHPGHIECLEMARELGDKLVVIVNNDHQQELKIGKIFQDQDFRMKVVSSLRVVDDVLLSIDMDGSVCQSIETVVLNQKMVLGENTKFIFAKGGDRFVSNIPEVEVCNKLAIKIVDGLGAKTHNSTDFRNKKG
jgi:D-beta-D-heptose 7-phosphate kinase/D-beta-D-heptose 1-phosphate adenosyltransferase